LIFKQQSQLVRNLGNYENDEKGYYEADIVYPTALHEEKLKRKTAVKTTERRYCWNLSII